MRCLNEILSAKLCLAWTHACAYASYVSTRISRSPSIYSLECLCGCCLSVCVFRRCEGICVCDETGINECRCVSDEVCVLYVCFSGFSLPPSLFFLCVCVCVCLSLSVYVCLHLWFFSLPPLCVYVCLCISLSLYVCMYVPCPDLPTMPNCPADWVCVCIFLWLVRWLTGPSRCFVQRL